MALQSLLNTTQPVAPCVRGGVSMRVRREGASGFAQDAKYDVAARGGASAFAETKLVPAAKKGNETAFRELVENHKGRIYPQAFRIVGIRRTLRTSVSRRQLPTWESIARRRSRKPRTGTFAGTRGLFRWIGA